MKVLKINSLLLALLLVFLSIVTIKSQTAALDPNFNPGVSEGVVQVVASAIQPDGKILVGGGFSLANGFERNTLVRLNADGTLDTTFNMGGVGPGGTIWEIALQPDGKILIAGFFTLYNGVATPAGLIRLNPNGSLDTAFNTGGAGIKSGVNTGTVHTIALLPDNSGRFMISGTFDSYNGTLRNSVARINADGTLDTTFNSLFASTQFAEEVDVQADGKILVAGGITQYDGQTRNGVARLNSDGTLDTGFVPATNFGDGFYAMLIQSDGKILIGGATNNAGAPIIKRLNADGGNDSSFVPPTLSGVAAEYFAIQSDNKILVTGRFNTASQTNVGLLRLNPNGSLDSSFPLESLDNTGYHVALQSDGKIIFSGYFTRYAGQTHKHIVRLNTNGTIDSSFNPSPVGWGFVTSVVQQADDKIVAAGNFLFANGSSRVNVARFNPNGTLDSTFMTSTGTFPDPVNGSNIINAAALQTDGKILIAGGFGGYNGVARRGIARLNANGTLDATFNAAFLASATTVSINDIFVLPDGKILVGGFVFDQTFTFLCRLNSDGSLDNTFNQGGSGASNTVRKILRQLSDGKIIAVGGFTSYNGVGRQRIVRLDPNGALDPSFNSSSAANLTINDAALQSDGKILIGGTFAFYGGASSNRIARLNSDGSLDASFNVGTGFDNAVETITVQPVTGRIFVGGRFSTYNGATANRFAALNPDGSVYPSLSSGFDSDARFFVRKLTVQSNGHLLVGGLFKQYNNASKLGILRLMTGQTAPSLIISGNVKADSTNLSGATVALGGDGNNTALTDTNGNYSFGNLAAGGNYTISVNKTGYNFPSNNQTFANLQTNQTADFAGTQLCTPPPSGSQGGAGNCQNASETPVSANNEPVNVMTTNDVDLTFGNVTTPGTTVATEVQPESTGALPNSYTFIAGETAYDVRTSAAFTGSIEVCFPVSTVNDPAVFARLSVLHNENGNLVDRTSSRAFAARKICASVTSLSPFVFAQLNPPTKSSVSGLIAYGTSPANQTQKFVPGVVFSASGASSAMTTSNSLGTYLLGDLNAGGQYTVTPSKTASTNGITAFDATLILRHVAAGGQGANALNANQQLAANTDGTSGVSAFDATLILRFVAANGANQNTGQTGDWQFTPQSQNYSALNNSLENENYTAILLGDVDGDWTASGNGLSAEREEKTTSVKETSGETRLSKAKSDADRNIVTIPVRLTGGFGETVSSYSFAVTFDPNVLQTADSAIIVSGSLSNGFQVVTDINTPGRLGIAAAGGADGAVLTNDTLLYLRFKVVGKSGARSKMPIANLGFAESLFENEKGKAIKTALSQ